MTGRRQGTILFLYFWSIISKCICEETSDYNHFFLSWTISGFPKDIYAADTAEIYFEDVSHLLSVKLYPLAKINSLELKVPDGTISLQPNGTGSLGLGFSVGLPASKKSIEQKGETGRFDLQISYFGERLETDGFIQQYKGYYMANLSDFIPWDNPNFPVARDLWVFSLGGSVQYIFNSEKLSVKAAYLRNQIQKKMPAVLPWVCSFIWTGWGRNRVLSPLNYRSCFSNRLI